MQPILLAFVVACTALTVVARAAQPAMADLLDRATRYVLSYETGFFLLAMDEEYVQWLERPDNPTTAAGSPRPITCWCTPAPDGGGCRSATS
jgi:hypothetical protein